MPRPPHAVEQIRNVSACNSSPRRLRSRRRRGPPHRCASTHGSELGQTGSPRAAPLRVLIFEPAALRASASSPAAGRSVSARLPADGFEGRFQRRRTAIDELASGRVVPVQGHALAMLLSAGTGVAPGTGPGTRSAAGWPAMAAAAKPGRGAPVACLVRNHGAVDAAAEAYWRAAPGATGLAASRPASRRAYRYSVVGRGWTARRDREPTRQSGAALPW